MRKERLGSYQLGALIADMRETHLKQVARDKITDSMIRKAWNDAVMLYYDLSGIKDMDYYADIVNVPIIKSVISNAASGGSYTGATKILTLPKTGDIIWTEDTEFNDDWVGANFTLRDTVSGLNYTGVVTAFIETVGNLTSVSIESETVIPDIAGANLQAEGGTTADTEADEVDLTRYANYKRIDKIIKMTSSNLRSGDSVGLCIGPPVLTSREFEGLKASHKTEYSNYKGDILWFRRGEILERSLGYSLTVYGTCKLELTLFPAVMIANSDYLDVPDTNKPQVEKIALVKVYSYLKKEDQITGLPADAMQYYNELTGSKAAKAEEKAS